MNGFNMGPGTKNDTEELKDAVSVSGEADDSDTERNELPVTTFDDYKAWCDKVRQEWDIS